ncbi:MAG TPA: dihydrofolate reductase family protein [Streptosporangiaceae bacterium]|jgi:dihydrofolate reductase
MGKIVVSENVTLDGVVRDPMGDEGTGGWFSSIGDKDREEWSKVLAGEAMGAEALLLGRRTDEWFANRWLTRESAWAERLNSMPKYVVSSTLEEPKWSNATVLRGDVVKEVTALKQELDGEIVVNASIQLAHTLLEHDLVDEVRLLVFPVVVGSGERLFGEVDAPRPLRLLSTRAVGDSIALLTYERAC